MHRLGVSRKGEPGPVIGVSGGLIGARAGWWAKTVQLDLEAKGVIARGRTRPLRLRKA